MQHFATRGDASSNEKRSWRRDLKLARQLWPFVRAHRRFLFGALALLPFVSLLTLIPPILVKRGIDEAIIPGEFAALLPIVLMLFAATIGGQLVQMTHTMLLQLTGQRSMNDLRQRAHAHALKLRVSYFDTHPLGNLISRVTNDVESIAEAFASGAIALVADMVTLIGILAAMLWLDLSLALLTMALLPPLLVIVLTFQRLLRQTYRDIRSRLANINGGLREQLAGVVVTQLCNREAAAEVSFDDWNRKYRDSYHRAIRYDATLFALVELIGSLVIAGILWKGGADVIKGTCTFGLLVAFVEYVQRFFVPIRDLSAKYAVMQQAFAAAERVFGLLALDATEPEGPPLQDGKKLSPDESEPLLEIRNLYFGYRPGTPILRDIHFKIATGETLAVIGPTGSGKSTLARLITRLYEPAPGQIWIRGVDVTSLDLSNLRKRIVYLGQDVVLFAGTVGSNISLADPTLANQAVSEAAEMVGLTRYASLDKEVIERGANLSQGEKQLIVFARALARKPDLLILDEATANIDPITEQVIERGMAELMRHTTAIVIAHRLSTIERADRIMVLHSGKTIECGTHETLLKQEGLYRQLWRLQHA